MIYTEERGQVLLLAQLTIEEANAPREVLSHYFSGASLPRRLEHTQQLIVSSASEQAWDYQKNHSPYIIVSHLEKLLEAVYLLQRDKSILADNNSKVSECALQGPMVDVTLYCRPDIHRPTWDYLPRHLQHDEFINPYLALTRLFDCRDLPGWRYFLSELIEFATLGKSSIYEIWSDFDMQEAFSLLYRVIEAAHLIDVRENKKGMSSTKEH